MGARDEEEGGEEEGNEQQTTGIWGCNQWQGKYLLRRQMNGRAERKTQRAINRHDSRRRKRKRDCILVSQTHTRARDDCLFWMRRERKHSWLSVSFLVPKRETERKTEHAANLWDSLFTASCDSENREIFKNAGPGIYFELSLT